MNEEEEEGKKAKCFNWIVSLNGEGMCHLESFSLAFGMVSVAHAARPKSYWIETILRGYSVSAQFASCLSNASLFALSVDSARTHHIFNCEQWAHNTPNNLLAWIAFDKVPEREYLHLYTICRGSRSRTLCQIVIYAHTSALHHEYIYINQWLDVMLVPHKWIDKLCSVFI